MDSMIALRKSCPICASDTISSFYSGKPTRAEWRNEGTFDVWKCTNCTHRFTNPIPDKAVLARCYSSQYNAYDPGHGIAGNLQQARELARLNKRYRHVDLRKDIDVLDVGCGSGSFLYVIRDLVGSVQGIEPSEHGVKTCLHLEIPVFHGDFESYHLKSERKYDLITLNHVLEHHPDPILLISLCRQHLKEGGRIWISVPNAGCFFAERLGPDWHSSDLPVHLQHFTIQSMRLAIDKSGLRIDECCTDSENSLHNSAAMLIRRFGVPHRVSVPLLKSPLSKTGWIGKRIDASGNGEAILVSALA